MVDLIITFAAVAIGVCIGLGLSMFYIWVRLRKIQEKVVEKFDAEGFVLK